MEGGSELTISVIIDHVKKVSQTPNVEAREVSAIVEANRLTCRDSCGLNLIKFGERNYFRFVLLK